MRRVLSIKYLSARLTMYWPEDERFHNEPSEHRHVIRSTTAQQGSNLFMVRLGSAGKYLFSLSRSSGI